MVDNIEEIIRFICAKEYDAEYIEVAKMLCVPHGKWEVKVAVSIPIEKIDNPEFIEYSIYLKHRIILDYKRDYRFGYSAEVNVIAYEKVAP